MPTADSNPPRRPLHVTGSLTVTQGEEKLRVTAEGSRIVIDAENLRTLRSVAELREAIAQHADEAAMLREHGLTLEVRLRGEPIATAGGQAKPGRLEQWLGLGPVAVSKRGLLKALLRND